MIIVLVVFGRQKGGTQFCADEKKNADVGVARRAPSTQAPMQARTHPRRIFLLTFCFTFPTPLLPLPRSPALPEPPSCRDANQKCDVESTPSLIRLWANGGSGTFTDLSGNWSPTSAALVCACVGSMLAYAGFRSGVRVGTQTKGGYPVA